MTRRLFAMLIAMMFWSIQTADAYVLHTDAGGELIAAQADDAGQPSVGEDASDKQQDVNGPGACGEGCPCHAVHNAVTTPPPGQTRLSATRDAFAYVRDPQPDHLSSPLNRPPLA